MRIATAQQSRRIDELAQKDYGLSGEILMEAAGSGAAREIEQSYFLELSRGAVAIVCGPGGNGADGLVVARHLHSSGCRAVMIFLVAPFEKRSPLFEVQLERCRKIGLVIEDLSTGLGERFNGKQSLFTSGAGQKISLLVDAVFGTDLRSEVKSPYREVIEAVLESKLPVVSLDAPSGLDCDRGIALGRAVCASQTITFGLAKPGFFISDGPSHIGRLRVLSIGLPRALFKAEATTHFAFSERMAQRYLPRRAAGSNKSSHGHALIFAGRPGMWGAALLASSAAYRVGAGYVTLASLSDAYEVLRENPEILTASAFDEKLWQQSKWKAVGIGPGLGTGDETAQLIERLKQSEGSRVVVDADAITVVARERLYPLLPQWVLTPHAGELSRLLGVEAREIESDRFRYAQEASRLLGCAVLLKGFRTVLAVKNQVWVILSGNSALAKAGTGDVLTGMITGLLAQGLSTPRAAATAAYVHGRMADEWVRSGHHQSSLQASDLREILPSILQRLTTTTSARGGRYP